MKKLIAGILILVGCLTGGYYIQSQGKDLTLTVLQDCSLNYAGDNCEEKYKITNTTKEVLDGVATFQMAYDGICGTAFDGVGIDVKYNDTESSWIDDTISFSGFTIPVGESFSSITMLTNVALCPGNYSYTFTLTGSADIEETYSPPSSGGGFIFTPPVVPDVPVEQVVFNGNLIRNPNDEGLLKYDIYIVKLIGDKQFKRLILNPHVFNSYEHLDWNNVILVDEDIMAEHMTSSLVRVRDYPNGVFEDEVYRLYPNGDVGIKRHLNMSQAEFENRGYDSDSIYNINCTDRDAYITEEDIL